MNPVVIVHFLVAIVSILVALPLIRRKVKMNRWYGVRIPAAFESDENWYDINEFGGWMFAIWGVAIGFTAIVGALLPQPYWIAYNFAAVGVITIGLAVVLILIYRHARRLRDRR